MMNLLFPARICLVEWSRENLSKINASTLSQSTQHILRFTREMLKMLLKLVRDEGIPYGETKILEIISNLL
jgi:hypothetical protein